MTKKNLWFCILILCWKSLVFLFQKLMEIMKKLLQKSKEQKFVIMNQLNPKWVLNDDDGFIRWEKLKPASELTLFEACNKLCFLWWSENCSKNEWNFIFCIEEILWIFLQIFDSFLWQVILNIIFSLHLIYWWTVLVDLEFSDELSRKNRSFLIIYEKNELSLRFVNFSIWFCLQVDNKKDVCIIPTWKRKWSMQMHKIKITEAVYQWYSNFFDSRHKKSLKFGRGTVPPKIYGLRHIFGAWLLLYEAKKTKKIRYTS